MLTKEECLEALDEMEIIYYEHDDSFCGMQSFGKSIDTIAKLINEHFDNPALHLDELKIGMWVYDATINKYRRIVNIQENKLYFEGQKLSVNFKENKFYRKLVE